MVEAPRVSPDGDSYVDGDDRDRNKTNVGGWSIVSPKRRAMQFQNLKKTPQYNGHAGFGSMSKGIGGGKKGASLQKVTVPLTRSSGTFSKPYSRFTPGSISSSWKDVCVMGRKVSAGSDLEFIAPIKKGDGIEVASISRSDILDHVNKWSNTLLGYIIENKPFFMYLKACVTRLWKLDCSLDIYS